MWWDLRDKPDPPGVSTAGAPLSGHGHLLLKPSDGRTVGAGPLTQGTGVTPGPAQSFGNVIPQVKPPIVRIDVTLTNGMSSGSGTIVDRRGYMLTNAHVVTGGQSILATLDDGPTLNAAVVAADTAKDLAIVKLRSNRSDFQVVALGTAADVEVGESVMAAGFPAGPDLLDLPGPVSFNAVLYQR